MRSIILSVLALIMISSGAAQARVLFDLNAMYGTTKAEVKTSGTQTTTTDQATTTIDIKLGYIGASGLYLGGLYTSRSSKDNVLSTDSSGSAMGASLGYMGSSGFFVMGHYLMSGTLGDYKEGTGMQADVGFKSMVSANVAVGAELTYRTLTYKKNETLSNFESLTVSEVMPMFSVGLIF